MFLRCAVALVFVVAPQLHNAAAQNLRATATELRAEQEVEAACSCNHPSGGTVDRNGFTCSDPSKSGWCTATQMCASNGTWAYSDLGSVCQEVTCKCDGGFLSFYTCSDPSSSSFCGGPNRPWDRCTLDTNTSWLLRDISQVCKDPKNHSVTCSCNRPHSYSNLVWTCRYSSGKFVQSSSCPDNTLCATSASWQTVGYVEPNPTACQAVPVPETACSCDDPFGGTVDRNHFMCSDWSKNGWCAATQVCASNGTWAYRELGSVCQEVTCTCDGSRDSFTCNDPSSSGSCRAPNRPWDECTLNTNTSWLLRDISQVCKDPENHPVTCACDRPLSNLYNSWTCRGSSGELVLSGSCADSTVCATNASWQTVSYVEPKPTACQAIPSDQLPKVPCLSGKTFPACYRGASSTEAGDFVASVTLHAWDGAEGVLSVRLKDFPSANITFRPTGEVLFSDNLWLHPAQLGSWTAWGVGRLACNLDGSQLDLRVLSQTPGWYLYPVINKFTVTMQPVSC